ncbi:MAG: hypothetical protein P4L99_05945 [Chthoniobacter sp.]|nr:hypothetical protein [Chthoniobacter sp.]
MNFFHEVDHERRRLITVFEGDVTMKDALQHIEHRAVQGTIGYAQLIDATHSRVVFTPAEADRIAKVMKEHADNGPIGPTAFLANNDSDFGMYRLFGTMTDEAYPVNVFRSWEAAQRWLGWMNEEYESKSHATPALVAAP